ncbi:MAG TPA: alpha/beta fold hydrolase, partial [Magnetospirillum sp.]|nr:alpha/beta fold hydrolase [Magnetospirillum sp.]
PVCLPGHGERMAEPLLNNLDAMAADIFQRIAPQLRSSDVLYGHSMGALLAFAVVRRARALLFPLPRAIVVSGMRGPSLPTARGRHLLSREDLRGELRRLGGSPEEVLGNEEMFDFIEPLARADFTAVETRRYVAEPPLPVPITLLLGEDDEITPAEGQAWQRETQHPLRLTTLPGGHFFIFRHAATMRQVLLDALKAPAVAAPAGA